MIVERQTIVEYFNEKGEMVWFSLERIPVNEGDSLEKLEQQRHAGSIANTAPG